MRLLLVFILLSAAEVASAAQQLGCKPQLEKHALSLLDIRVALDELKLAGSIKTQEELSEFLLKFKNLSESQKKFLLPHVLKQISDSKKTRDLKDMNVFVAERSALSAALGIIHNPYDLYNHSNPQNASAFLKDFLSQRNAPYSLAEIQKSIQLLRKKLKSPNEFALIFGSFPNAYAKTRSDIDVVWKRDGSTAISLGEENDLNRSLKEEKGILNSLHFSHGTYDPHEQQFFLASSKVNIEVHQDKAYLLLYPADFEVNYLGPVTTSEPIRILLDEERL